MDAWAPQTLFLTHFGPASDPAAHLAEMREHLELAARLARSSLAREGGDEVQEQWFVGEWRRRLRDRLPEDEAQAYEVAAPFDLNWRGLARYWRKRGE